MARYECVFEAVVGVVVDRVDYYYLSVTLLPRRKEVSDRVEQITRNASPMAQRALLLSPKPCIRGRYFEAERPREDLSTRYEFKHRESYKRTVINR